MPDLVDADPAGFLIAYLANNSVVTEALGGPGRVGLKNKPPYPRLGIADTPGGSDLDFRWLSAPELTLKLWGDLDGSPGKAQLRRILFTIVQVIRDIPDQPSVPGQPVITAVRSNGAFGWLPEPTGQPKYEGRIQLFMHPPIAIPEPTP